MGKKREMWSTGTALERSLQGFDDSQNSVHNVPIKLAKENLTEVRTLHPTDLKACPGSVNGRAV